MLVFESGGRRKDGHAHYINIVLYVAHFLRRLNDVSGLNWLYSIPQVTGCHTDNYVITFLFFTEFMFICCGTLGILNTRPGGIGDNVLAQVIQVVPIIFFNFSFSRACYVI
jgi:hypothetical protein